MGFWEDSKVSPAEGVAASSEQIVAPHGNDKCKIQSLASGVDRLCMILLGPKSPNGADEHCALGHRKVDLMLSTESSADDCKNLQVEGQTLSSLLSQHASFC